MTSGELAYLILSIVGVLAFMGTLAWVSRRTNPKARVPQAHRAGIR